MVKRTGHSSIYAVYHVSNYPSRALWGERKRQLYLSDTLADCPKHFSPKSTIPNSFHIDLHNVGDQPGLGLLKQRAKLLLHVVNLGTQISKHGNNPKVKTYLAGRSGTFKTPKDRNMQRQLLMSTCKCFRVPQFRNAMALARCNSQTAPFHLMFFYWSSCQMLNHSQLSTQTSFPCRSHNRF